jgi:hypothetical protein
MAETGLQHSSKLREVVTMEHIAGDIVRIALDKVEGFPFERFATVFYSALIGATFVPLGGLKDGGADARDGAIFEDGDRAESYYQASVEIDTEGKIRRTVQRLKEFGRSPKRLTYLTSRTVKYSDRVERDLTDELNVTILIKDGGYIAAHINDGSATRGAFDEHLRHYTDFLKQVGSSRLITSSKHVTSPAVYVFLAHEIERREGDESLVNAVTDALALWALEGTDPDLGKLRSSAEVLELITNRLPSVEGLVAPRVERRLKAMSEKSYSGGRAVNWHKQQDAFCLPYETRRRIEEENTADEALRLQVLNSLDDRLRADPVEGLGDVGIREAVEVALRTLQLTFEREGLEFASFLRESDQHDYPTIADSLKATLAERGLSGRHGQRVGDGAFTILRGVLYESRNLEREYLLKLSRTYALLFTLNTEPRLIEFFQNMTGDFDLYVGSDQIVRALSEHYLAEPDQMTRNTLLMASRLGAKLVLAEPALEEVVNHFRACDYEYRNHIAAVEHHVTFEFARHAPQIMLRAYLYARLNDQLGKRRPRSWQGFVQQFCTYSDLHRPAGIGEIRQYLQATFGLRFESTDELERLVNLDDVTALAGRLRFDKRDDRLARNDALLALAVFGKRRRNGETSQVSEFGFSTWWLTSETSILKYTREIRRKNEGARYIMRPDFLLNFLTLAPKAAHARQAFSSVFPSLLGIKLARRMNHEAFDKIMDTVTEAEELDEARRTVVIAKASDQLKSDFRRQYLTLDNDHHVATVDMVAARSVNAEDQ